MFIKKANIKLYAAALFSALIASSCLNLDETQDGAYGYLTISGIDVDINVSELVPTKSGSTVDIESVRNYVRPDLSSATVKVTDSKGKVYDWKGQQLTLPLGAYTVSATYGSNTFDAPCFVGTASGTISDAASSATVKFTLANSVMKVTNTIPEHYAPVADNPVKISLVNDATKNVSAPIGTYVFVPYGETLKVDVTGMSTAGAEKNFSYTMTSATEACKAYNVQIADGGASMHEVYLSDKQIAWGDMIVIKTPATFKGISSANQSSVVYEAIPVPSEGAEADWSDPKKATDGVISGLESGTSYCVRARVGGVTSSPVTLTPAVTGLSASAAHTDTNDVAEGGDLDGTDVVATFKSPHDKVTEAISSWSFVVCKSTDENTALRTFNFAEGAVSGTAISDGSALTGTTDWPYLPQGNYTLIATATLKNGTKVSSKAAIGVSAPTFGVTVSGYTTYDKYLEYTQNKQATTLTEANRAGYAEYIFQISSTISGISETLLKNTNYTTKVFYSCGPYNEAEFDFVNGDGDTDTATMIHNIGDVGGFSWGENSLIAKINFAGSEVTSKPRLCHITGLPYSSVPTINDKIHPWTIDAQNWAAKFSWGANEFYMYTDSASGTYNKIGSPLFHIPININCAISVSAHGCLHALLTNDIEWRVYSGDSSADFVAEYNNNEYKVYNINSLMLYSTNSKIQLESREYTAYRKSYINNVSIMYR